jgi:putative iron-dependent peroxidase
MTIRPIRVRWIQRRPEAASRMLDSMAGLITGTRDALTRFTQPLTGSYYFVPSVERLRFLR